MRTVAAGLAVFLLWFALGETDKEIPKAIWILPMIGAFLCVMHDLVSLAKDADEI